MKMQRLSPEVKSWCNGLLGITDIQASEVVLWVAVRAFIKVTIPAYHYANGSSLENRIFKTIKKKKLFSKSATNIPGKEI